MNAGPYRMPLFTSRTAAGTSAPYDCSPYSLLTLYVTGYNTIDTGTLVIEEADFDYGTGGVQGPMAENVFPGTWSAIETIDLTDVTGGGAEGLQIAYHLPTTTPGHFAYRAVRGRLSVAVTGASGAVDVVLVARA